MGVVFRKREYVHPCTEIDSSNGHSSKVDTIPTCIPGLNLYINAVNDRLNLNEATLDVRYRTIPGIQKSQVPRRIQKQNPLASHPWPILDFGISRALVELR